MTFAAESVPRSMWEGVKETQASAAQGKKNRTVHLPSTGCGPSSAKGSEWRAARRASICALRLGSRGGAGAVGGCSCNTKRSRDAGETGRLKRLCRIVAHVPFILGRYLGNA